MSKKSFEISPLDRGHRFGNFHNYYAFHPPEARLQPLLLPLVNVDENGDNTWDATNDGSICNENSNKLLKNHQHPSPSGQREKDSVCTNSVTQVKKKQGRRALNVLEYAIARHQRFQRRKKQVENENKKQPQKSALSLQQAPSAASQEDQRQEDPTKEEDDIHTPFLYCDLGCNEGDLTLAMTRHLARFISFSSSSDDIADNDKSLSADVENGSKRLKTDTFNSGLENNGDGATEDDLIMPKFDKDTGCTTRNKTDLHTTKKISKQLSVAVATLGLDMDPVLIQRARDKSSLDQCEMSSNSSTVAKPASASASTSMARAERLQTSTMERTSDISTLSDSRVQNDVDNQDAHGGGNHPASVKRKGATGTNDKKISSGVQPQHLSTSSLASPPPTKAPKTTATFDVVNLCHAEEHNSTCRQFLQGKSVFTKVQQQQQRQPLSPQPQLQPEPRRFDLITIFSTTMWIHVHAGDEGLRAFLRRACQWSDLLLIEPQPSKCYRTMNNRLRKLHRPRLDIDLSMRCNVEEAIENAIVKECGFRRVPLSLRTTPEEANGKGVGEGDAKEKELKRAEKGCANGANDANDASDMDASLYKKQAEGSECNMDASCADDDTSGKHCTTKNSNSQIVTVTSSAWNRSLQLYERVRTEQLGETVTREC